MAIRITGGFAFGSYGSSCQVIAVLICGRFFYYVAKDARISNTPPNSELEDRVSLLWTWFGFLAAYVCQLLMGVGLIIGTKKTDTETVLGNCQLWIYGAHILDLYTVIEFLIVCYFIFSVKNFQGSRAILVAVLAIIKIVFRVVAFVVVKLFMADLNRPSCSCPVPPQQQQTQLQQHQQQQQQQVHQQQQQTQTSHQPQMMGPAPPPNSQFQPASYHPS